VETSATVGAVGCQQRPGILALIWPDAVPISKDFLRHALVFLLATMVLSGGMFPAMYAGLMPHTHLFIGGPPPPDWEDHEHPNPLDALFGPPVAATSPLAHLSADQILNGHGFGLSVPNGLGTGRVVSIYQGSSILVLSLLALTVLLPSWSGMHWLSYLGSAESVMAPLPSSIDSQPDFPPPRTSPSP